MEDDIRYVRSMAEGGANAPLLGGRFMVWWGLLLTAAYLTHHLALKGTIGNGPAVFGLLWAAFAISGPVGHCILIRTMPAKAGGGSAGNRASRVVWIAAAMAIASMVGGSTALSMQGSGPAAFDWIVPVAFAAYACALISMGALARNNAVLAAGGGAVAMVGLFTALILTPDRYLVAAAGVFLTVLVPGLLLFRAEPR
jgi:hypothetical protein